LEGRSTIAGLGGELQAEAIRGARIKKLSCMRRQRGEGDLYSTVCPAKENEINSGRRHLRNVYILLTCEKRINERETLVFTGDGSEVRGSGGGAMILFRR